MDALHVLTDGTLRALVAALRNRWLSRPYTTVAVQKYCGDADASAAVAELLCRLADIGMTADHLALVTEAILQVRARVTPPGELVELVWTGPETLGTANRDTGVVVRDLFGNAESDLIVAGFAVHQGYQVFRRLADRMAERPALRVRLFLNVHWPGEEQDEGETLRVFAMRFRSKDWPWERLPEVYYDPRSLYPNSGERAVLHAKCVVADRRIALVTSANFTEAAQTRNIEVGTLVRCPDFCANLADHFEALVEVGALRRLGLGV
jgi:phosphatidylserine/phosphatidylglycerophosphate/cardiolipin synthase-like enzyme